jgi:hypothetical protein
MEKGSRTARPRKSAPLPSPIREIFWDVDAKALRWESDRDLIIGRVLASGPWETVKWLRAKAGDDTLRSWLERYEGRGLSPKQLRFWQLVLGLPARKVDEWLESDRRGIWDRRTRS